jgi:hypothetical protein
VAAAIVRIRLKPRHAIVALGALGSLALHPALAEANLEEGRPEWYGNNTRLTATSRTGVVQWGELNLVHEFTPAEGGGERRIGCGDARSFGYLTNEGTPAFGKGQILAWQASGGTGATSGDRSCRWEQSGVEGAFETWLTDEPEVGGSNFEPPVEGGRKTPLSVPWNIELLCVEREGVKSALIEIGVPDGASAPASECKTETARAEEIAGEEERRKGCFATTVPEGCIKLNAVQPLLAFEQILEGSLQLKYKNGFTNGLHPSTWEYEGGAAAGQLHWVGHFAWAFHLAPAPFANSPPNLAKNVGFGALQLITVK